jgi:DNA-binding beta-propeller fold protein YncE
MVLRSDDRQVVATLDLGTTFTHDTKSSPDGSLLLSANPITGLLTRIATDEATETWTPDGALDLRAVTGQGPVCVAYRPDGARAYVSLFGAAGGIAVVDVASMSFLGKLPTAGSVACGLVNSKDGRTIFIVSNGGTGHLYRLDTATDTLTEETGYGPIGLGLHGLITTANEKDAYATAVAAEAVKILDLEGSEVRTITLDPRPGIRDSPDSIARRGGNIYVTLRFAGQVARIQAQSGNVDYIDLTPPATSGYAVHGIAVRP